MPPFTRDRTEADYLLSRYGAGRINYLGLLSRMLLLTLTGRRGEVPAPESLPEPAPRTVTLDFGNVTDISQSRIPRGSKGK